MSSAWLRLVNSRNTRGMLYLRKEDWMWSNLRGLPKNDTLENESGKLGSRDPRRRKNRRCEGGNRDRDWFMHFSAIAAFTWSDVCTSLQRRGAPFRRALRKAARGNDKTVVREWMCARISGTNRKWRGPRSQVRDWSERSIGAVPSRNSDL